MIHHRNQKITPTQGKTVFLSDELLHEVLVTKILHEVLQCD
jgi:hypothetical protein